MKDNNPLLFRFEVYSTGTSSLQTDSYTTMGAYLVRLFCNFLCSFSYSGNLVDLFCLRLLSLYCAGDFSIHACQHCLYSHWSSVLVCFPRCMLKTDVALSNLSSFDFLISLPMILFP